MTITRWTLAFVIGVGSTALGQAPTPSPTPTPSPSPTPPSRIWRCELPAGTYEVLLPAITAVSRHEYVVDVIARVNEVNVDTQGNMAARFYFIEPNTPKAPAGIGQSALDRASELAREVAQQTNGDEAWKRVVKSYPTTTHAHTIEYRVKSQDQLNKIFSSVQAAFETGKGSTLTFSD